MKMKKIILCSIALALAATAQAVPAKRGTYTVTQPDGTTLTVSKVGDEFMHFTVTDDNRILTTDADGQFCYARIDAAGNLVSTGIKALDSRLRPASQSYLTTELTDALMSRVRKLRDAADPQKAAVRDQRRTVRRADSAKPQLGLGLFPNSTFPITGKPNAIVILVEFSDEKFHTSYVSGAHDYFNHLLNQRGFSEYNGTGCVSEYFDEMSKEQFQPQFKLYGPVTLSGKMADYGGNDSRGNDKAPERMVVEACQALDGEVNFADFDNDGDGLVDNIFVFYAGQGEASYGGPDTIWPHSYDVRYAGHNIELDGVTIATYGCANEWEISSPDGVGTYIHEFSHVLGLPDLYHTSSSSASYTPGSYSVLDYGPYNNNGRTPPAYSIYERNAMGWIDPTYLGEEPVSITLGAITDTNEGCLIPTEKDTEFFLIENRQQKGWDTYIPGHGMLVWHIDYVPNIFSANSVNNTKSHQYVDIIEANANPNNTNLTTMEGYPFPGSTMNTELGFATSPSLKSWSGQTTGVEITDISEEDGIVTFSVNGGLYVPAPEPVTPDDYSLNHFVASWAPVSQATDYSLTVWAVADFGTVSDYVANFDDCTLPEGWSTNSTEWYASASTMSNAPALKLTDTGQYLSSPKFEGDISAIYFWYRGFGNGVSSSSIDVQGKINGEWVSLNTLAPAIAAKEFLLSTVPAGVKQVRIVYTKSKGNLGLDNVTVTAGGVTRRILDGYDGILTQGATSVTVSPLIDGVTTYEYSVQTIAGYTKSKASPVVTVKVSDDAAVSDITTGDTTASVSVIGSIVTVTTTAPYADVFDATGRLARRESVSGGSASFEMPRGFYIVRAGDSVSKIAVY